MILHIKLKEEFRFQNNLEAWSVSHSFASHAKRRSILFYSQSDHAKQSKSNHCITKNNPIYMQWTHRLISGGGGEDYDRRPGMSRVIAASQARRRRPCTRRPSSSIPGDDVTVSSSVINRMEVKHVRLLTWILGRKARVEEEERPGGFAPRRERLERLL